MVLDKGEGHVPHRPTRKSCEADFCEDSPYLCVHSSKAKAYSFWVDVGKVLGCNKLVLRNTAGEFGCQEGRNPNDRMTR